jgi:DNA mismatch repair protein MutS
MAIARAVLEYCADKRRLGAKTMFATHYHELSALEGEITGVRNYNITAKKQGGTLVFLRKIVRGAADDSYGIEVAKLAGLPDAVINKAKGYLRELETEGTVRAAAQMPAEDQISLSDLGADEVRRILQETDLNTLTPIEAMNLLFDLQKKARG